MSLIFDIGQSLIFELVQILFGCLIAYIIYKGLSKKSEIIKELNNEKILLIILLSLAGLVLPIGIYGVIPIVLILINLEIKVSCSISVLASNFVFNMLVPFTETGFNWRSGILRILLAFVIGIASGLLLELFKIDRRHISRLDGINGNPKSFPGILNGYILSVGIFLILGVILEVIFKKYYYYDFINIVNISNISTSVFSVIKNYDITTNVFIMNMILFNLIMNIKTLSGVLYFFKWKAAVSYYVYFGIWVCILCVINIFV